MNKNTIYDERDEPMLPEMPPASISTVGTTGDGGSLGNKPTTGVASRDLIASREMPLSPTPMDLLAEAMRNPDFKPEMLTQLMDWQERYEKNQARKAFDAAMAAAMAEIPTVKKNRKVDFTNRQGQRTHYSYEDLGEVLQTVKPILAKYGLTVRWRQKAEPNQPIIVTCIIAHRQGHFEENSLPGPRDQTGNKNEHQQVGSGLTYLQRYTLKAALGLAASEDDDGQASGSSSEDTTPVTDEQFQTIQDLVFETGTDVEKFCRYLHVDSLKALQAARFDEVVGELNRKKRALGR